MATYTIKSGDNLSTIAANNGTTVAALMAANPQITNANLIYAGQSLTIPSSSSSSTASTPTTYINQQTQQSYPIGTASPGYNAQGQPTSTAPQTIYNTPSMATQPYQTQPTQPTQSAPTWNLSSWTASGGKFTTQPVLTINGQDFTFNTPQEYIDKMQSAGLTGGNVSTFISQFQSAQPAFTSSSSQTTSNAQNTGSGASGSQTGSQTGSTTTTPTSTTSSQTNPTSLTYDSGLAAYGIPQDLWNQMNPTQQVSVMIAYDTAKAQYAQNASFPTVQQALATAAADPNIVNKYADLANVTAADLQNSVSQIAQQASITSQQQQAQMQQAQANLEKTFGGAGTAYSSFAQGAQQQLNTQNQGIIQSTASQYQQALRSAGESAEQLYGSSYSGLNNMGVNYVNPLTGQNMNIGYTPIGGVTGSVAQQKSSDINAEALQNIQLSTPASLNNISA